MASTIIVDLGAGFSYDTIMLAPEQSRAARGWLDWSQEQLAERAGVSLSTVRDFEKGRRTPIGNNLRAIRTAIESAGLVLLFSDDAAAGVARGAPGYSSGPSSSS